MATTRIPTDLEGVYIARTERSPGVYGDTIAFDDNSPYKEYMNSPEIQGYINTFGGTGAMQPAVILDRLRGFTGQAKPADADVYTGSSSSNTEANPHLANNSGWGSYDLPQTATPVTPTPGATSPTGGTAITGPINPIPQSPSGTVGPVSGGVNPTNTWPSLSMPLNGQEIPIDPNTGLPMYVQDPSSGSWIPNPAGGGASGSPGGTPNTGSNPFYPTNTGGPVSTTSGTFQQAPFPEGVGGNYQQVQNSVQGGQFQTTGQTNQAQASTTGQTGAQTQTGAQNTTETSTQSTTPDDTLGFGALLQGAAQNAQGTDATRNAWLMDTMQTGGSQFGSQVDQAIRNSQTGPQMTGAGDSAKARMGAYAASDIARNNLSQRLGAAEQLAGPTALSSLSTAANPYIGQTSTGTNQSLSNTLSNLTSSSAGWQNLLNQTNESQAGSTTAQASQAGAGNIPEGTPMQSKGGCVLCTAALELGLSNHRHILRRVIDYKLNHAWPRFRRAARGYFALFTPFARWLLDHPVIAAILWPLAKMVVYEELRISGRKLPLRVGAWLVHWIGHVVCSIVGLLKVRGHVIDPVILAIAQRENVIFNVRN